MSDRIVARIVWVLAALALVVTAFGIWYDLRNTLVDESPLFVADGIAWALLPAVFVLSGALIVSRQPRNVIGLLLMIPGLVFLAAGVIDVAFGIAGAGAPAGSHDPRAVAAALVRQLVLGAPHLPPIPPDAGLPDGAAPVVPLEMDRRTGDRR